MDLFDVFILSVVEGVSEFLPISSTGHLILASDILGIKPNSFSTTFNIAIQLGAIMSVVYLYFKKLVNDLSLLKKLFVAFLPSVVVGFLFYPLIKNFFLESTLVTTIALFLGGIVLLMIEKVRKEPSNKEIDFSKINYRNALLIGFFQSVSVIPGVSRAAATIIGGLSLGLNRSTATEFSFLLAIPTMFAATFYDIYKTGSSITTQGYHLILFGMLLSFVFSLVTVKFLINFVKRNSFSAFGVYRIIVAAIFYLLYL